jgi:hypothetical protein
VLVVQVGMLVDVLLNTLFDVGYFGIKVGKQRSDGGSDRG